MYCFVRTRRLVLIVVYDFVFVAFVNGGRTWFLACLIAFACNCDYGMENDLMVVNVCVLTFHRFVFSL